jgi:hypothetical protein
MEFSEFTYPPYGTPVVEAWNHRFEAAYVLFHPFIRVPEALSWKTTKQYPTDQQIAAHGEGLSWSDVVAATGLRSCAHLNAALLTSTGALPDYLRDSAARDALQSFSCSGMAGTASFSKRT